MIDEIKEDYSNNNQKEIGLKLRDPKYKESFFNFLCIELEKTASDYGYPASHIANSKIMEYEDFVKDLPDEEILEQKKPSILEDIEGYFSGLTDHQNLLDMMNSDFLESLLGIDWNIVDDLFKKLINDPKISKENIKKIKKYKFNFTLKTVQKKEDNLSS